MNSVTSVFLLYFLISIAAALKCYHGRKRNSDTCEQEAIECPKGDRCITISEEYCNHKTIRSIYKGCSGNIPCDEKPYGKANNYVYLMVSTKCCDTDYCNNQSFEMPKDDEPNGVVCPSCYEPNTVKECIPQNEMMCRGQDDNCVTFSGQFLEPDGFVACYSLKGCMSALGCKMDLSQLIGAQLLNQTIFKCTKSPLPGGEKYE
ncbi:phospholipase A2 inhibitor 1-like [Anomaloglossus baeobatrachus]|uniref:phospholipase A2 inhibitor 1-like n=1 Tax=Anomaloglossus baeobatrachus TaxID=238106 RepID=UPI003F4FCF75